MPKPITVYQFRFGRVKSTGDESWYAIDETGKIICAHVSSSRMWGIHDTGPHGFYSASFPSPRRLVILDDGDFPPDEVMRAAGFTRDDDDDDDDDAPAISGLDDYDLAIREHLDEFDAAVAHLDETDREADR